MDLIAGDTIFGSNTVARIPPHAGVGSGAAGDGEPSHSGSSEGLW